MNELKQTRIILASASPRRSELLQQIGLDFEVVTSDVEEVVTTDVPSQVVQELSCQKATAVFEEMVKQEGKVAYRGKLAYLVIGADTIVACDGTILGKPKNSEDAIKMLQMLQGRKHDVYTGVTFLYQDADGNRKKKTFYESTCVKFYPMSDEEIREYVATDDPLDKAGSYGIQGFCARYIAGIEGDYNTVVGLPVGRLYQEAKEFLS